LRTSSSKNNQLINTTGQRTRHSQADKHQIRNYPGLRHDLGDQPRIAARKEDRKILPPIAARHLQLSQNKTPKHEQATALDRLNRSATRDKVPQSALGGNISISNLAGMSPKLVTHQWHARTNEPTEMLAIPSNEICGDCSAEVEHKARTRGQVKPSKQREPAIEPQSLKFLIAIANTRHFSRRRRTDHRHIKGIFQQSDQCISLFSGSDADQPTKPEREPLERPQAVQQREIRIDYTLSHHQPGIGVEHTPLDKTVSAVELKNHCATSDSARRR
jgi:hypothetical protein